MNITKAPTKLGIFSRVFYTLLAFVALISGTQSIHASELSDAASALAPGSYVELSTQGFNEELMLQGGGHHMLQYAESMIWDPMRREIHFVGSGHLQGYQHIVYNEANNSWSQRPLPGFISSQDSHGYDHIAINLERREFYFRGFNQNRIWIYNLDSQSWTTSSVMSLQNYQVAGGMAWFQDMQRMIYVDGDFGLATYNPANNSWNTLSGSLGLGPYHNFAEVAEKDNVVVLGGGNGSGVIYHLSANGNLTRKGNAPQSMGTTNSITVYEPVSGDFIVFFADSTYQYRPSSDTWTRIGNTPPFSGLGDNGIFGGIATPISTHGVIMIAKYAGNNSKVYLYKYAEGDGNPPPDPEPPATVTSFTANPNTINAGGSTMLAWSSINATSCTASGAWSNTIDVNGSITISPTATGSYTLSCTGAGGSDLETLTVTVNTSPDNGDTGNTGDAYDDFMQRATSPGVVFFEAFDSEAAVMNKRFPDSQQDKVSYTTAQAASGGGSIQFVIPSNSPANSSGSWRTNFADDNYSIKFGSGEDLYVQWRQRFSASMLNTVYQTTSGNAGWKQVLIGEGDYAGFQFGDAGEVGSCSTLEVVLTNTNQTGFPQMYHSCGTYWPYTEFLDPYYFKLQNAIDAGPNVTPIENRFVLYPFEPANSTQLRAGSPAFPYYPNEWMTFQVRISPGPLGASEDPLVGGSASGFINSTVEMWVAREGQPSVKTHSFSGVVLRRDSGASPSDEKYGKIWLTPYHTNKDSSHSHAVGYTWYDEMIISRQRIADPGVPSSGGGGPDDPVPAPVFNQFTAAPSEIEQGQTSTLTWDVSNSNTCTASNGPWTGVKPSSGSQAVQPNNSSMYTLSCSGSGGAVSQSVSVTVNDPVPNQPPATPILSNYGVVPYDSYQFDIENAYSDPDGDALLRSEWQISSKPDSWQGGDVVADRTVESATQLSLPLGVLASSTNYWIRTRHRDANNNPSSWSQSVSFTTASQSSVDLDGDGTVDEYQVTEYADTNNNGVDDKEEGLCNLRDAETNRIMGFQPNSGVIKCHTSHSSSEVPGNDEYEYGMFSFTIDGLPVNAANPSSVDVVVHFPEDLPSGSKWFKYDPVTSTVNDYSFNVSMTNNVAVIRLVDGGVGDGDGVVNGVIVDPGGPVILAASGGGSTSSSSDGGGGGSIGIWMLISMLTGGYVRRNSNLKKYFYRIRMT